MSVSAYSIIKNILKIKETTPIVSLLEKCMQDDLKVYKRISIDVDHYKGFKLVNLENTIKKDDIIATVPTCYGLNGLDIFQLNKNDSNKFCDLISNSINKFINKEKDTNVYERIKQQYFLTYQAVIINKAHSSFLKDLVNSYPKDLLSLSCLDNSLLSQVNSKVLKINLMHFVNLNLRIYEDINKDSELKIDKETFLYFYLATLSQKICLYTENKAINYTSQDESVDLYSYMNKEINSKLSAKNNRNNIVEDENNQNNINNSITKKEINLILPLINIINHSFNNNCDLIPTWDPINKVSFVIIKANKDINLDEELSISYGDNLSNYELFLKYGFVEEENKNKFIEIPLACNNEEKNLIFESSAIDNDFYNYLDKLNSNIELKNKISYLEKFDLGLYENIKNNMITLYHNKFDRTLLKLLRIGFLEKHELESKRALDFNFDNIWSEKNEMSVSKYLSMVLNYFYKPHLNIDYINKFNTLKSNLTSKLAIQEYNINVVQNEEKEILEKNINYLRNKQNYLI